MIFDSVESRLALGVDLLLLVVQRSPLGPKRSEGGEERGDGTDAGDPRWHVSPVDPAICG
jgi:hypothetical protein